MIAKRCPRCEKTLPVSQFNKATWYTKGGVKKVGLKCYCKRCQSMYQTNWRKENKKRIKEYNRVYKDKYRVYKQLFETDKEKECDTCGEIKDKTLFPKMGGKYLRHCKSCHSKYMKEYRRRVKGLPPPLVETDTHKQCGECDKFLSKTEFSKYSNHDKLKRKCKTCTTAYHSRYRFQKSLKKWNTKQ